ncbi:hypothetical protein ANCCEY_03534 [Ancylostoma ceylanicum]|uniref:Uncharacterized protein n=1 Tax=Ancylostoma ceylanicum TaxID=53326 RepID=A0A0D6M4S8_9BILA|nr:hypothetical protein ANCCEY_03534 [Ancylostoma ceylanicum]
MNAMNSDVTMILSAVVALVVFLKQPPFHYVTVSSDGGSMVRHGVHETVEESFKQEITYERPASTDSREML